MSKYNTQSNITYSEGRIGLVSVSAREMQKTRKTVIGKTLVQTNIIGLNDKQWVLNVKGIITASLGTARARIEGYDDAESHAYVDGIHDGTYYVKPGTLIFNDKEEDVGNIYRYSMTLVEE